MLLIPIQSDFSILYVIFLIVTTGTYTCLKQIYKFSLLFIFLGPQHFPMEEKSKFDVHHPQLTVQMVRYIIQVVELK